MLEMVEQTSLTLTNSMFYFVNICVHVCFLSVPIFQSVLTLVIYVSDGKALCC